MKKLTTGLALLYVYPFGGIVLVCLLSFLQKLSIGADVNSLMGYIVPSLTGFISGGAISVSGYWYRKSFLQEKERSEHVAALNKQHEDFMHTLSEGVCTIDQAGRCLYANSAALAIFACAKKDVLGNNLFNIIENNEANLKKLILDDQIYVFDRCRLCRIDGTTTTVSVTVYPSQAALVLAFNELSSAASLKNKINFLHTHDPLCGVLNKEAWRARIEDVFHKCAEETEGSSTLFVIDIDRFKVINETISYAAGDHYLKDFAQYLVFKVGSVENISRTAGDEFSLLLEDHAVGAGKLFAEQLMAELNAFETFWQNKSLKCSVSIGACRIDRALKSSDHAFQGAHAACKTAKAEGRAQIRFYDPVRQEYQELQKQMEAVALIQMALEQDLFFLRGQDIAPVGCGDYKKGMEVLVSMRGVDGGVVSPGEFIPAAEKFDLMPNIDRWVIKKSIQWIENNQEICDNLDFISINISGKTFNHDGFAEFLFSTIEQTSIEPYKLCFEITETAAVNSRHATINFIDEVKKLGCRFALDDFGTGMSSFEYLKSFPVDFIKIDGSFICDIENDEISQEIVRSIQRIGAKLKVKTIAEHAETQQSLCLLRDMGIDYVQGYIINKPTALT